MAELALLSESIAVNAKDFLDWEIMRETIVCILTTKFGKLNGTVTLVLSCGMNYVHGVCSQGAFLFVTLPATSASVVDHVYSMQYSVYSGTVHNRGL